MNATTACTATPADQAAVRFPGASLGPRPSLMHRKDTMTLPVALKFGLRVAVRGVYRRSGIDERARSTRGLQAEVTVDRRQRNDSLVTQLSTQSAHNV